MANFTLWYISTVLAIGKSEGIMALIEWNLLILLKSRRFLSDLYLMGKGFLFRISVGYTKLTGLWPLLIPYLSGLASAVLAAYHLINLSYSHGSPLFITDYPLIINKQNIMQSATYPVQGATPQIPGKIALPDFFIIFLNLKCQIFYLSFEVHLFYLNPLIYML